MVLYWRRFYGMKCKNFVSAQNTWNEILISWVKLKEDKVPQTPPLHRKWSRPLRISPVNVTKSAVIFTEEILNGKLHSLCSVLSGWLNLKLVYFLQEDTAEQSTEFYQVTHTRSETSDRIHLLFELYMVQELYFSENWMTIVCSIF